MLYIVPSRGRPHNIVDLLASWEATRSTACLWICVDYDDPKIEEYRKIVYPWWATICFQERLRLGPTLNYWSEIYLNMPGEKDVIGFMGDDHRPRTVNWDQKILDTAHQYKKTAVIYTNDLLQCHNMATSVALTSNVVKTLGYMSPPAITHLYMDSAWLDMGKECGSLVYRPDIVVEHMHPIARKSEWDDLYSEVNSGEMYEADGRAYSEWKLETQWREKLRKLWRPA